MFQGTPRGMLPEEGVPRVSADGASRSRPGAPSSSAPLESGQQTSRYPAEREGDSRW